LTFSSSFRNRLFDYCRNLSSSDGIWIVVFSIYHLHF